VTQPAVSDRIRHLERVVGTEVFERTARGDRAEEVVQTIRRAIA
jgi:DNA-binding transcriptional LysR family regulator